VACMHGALAVCAEYSHGDIDGWTCLARPA
jgi:hypothetical protein